MLMIIGALIVAAAVALFPLAHSMAMLFGLRVVQGTGEAFFYVGAATIITDLAPPHRRGEAVSYFSVALYLGLALGPSLGEAVLSGGHYDRAWAVVSAWAVAAALLALVVREPPRPPVPETVARTGRLVHPAAVVPGTVGALGLIGVAAFSAFAPLYSIRIRPSASGPAFALYAAVTLAIRVLTAR